MHSVASNLEINSILKLINTKNCDIQVVILFSLLRLPGAQYLTRPSGFLVYKGLVENFTQIRTGESILSGIVCGVT